jgi:hypothetical protein
MIARREVIRIDALLGHAADDGIHFGLELLQYFLQALPRGT